MKGNLIVAQSGGPTSVINSSLLGVIEEAKRNRRKIKNIYGSLNGIDGIINEAIVDLKKEKKSELKKLRYTPSSILGSVRKCLPSDFNEKIYTIILEVFKKYDIRYFLYIGGNDSMDTVQKLSEFFKKVDYECFVIGVPKTIDNDLVITDHTPGYGSAIKYIANTIKEIYYDTICYAKGRVTVVEIMGRDAGWLTAGSKLANLDDCGPDLIYLPEVAFDIDKFLQDVNEIYAKKHKVLVCVSEGIKDKQGKYIMEQSAYANDNDVFGHMQLGGAASVLTHLVKTKLNLNVRAIELNLPQRCAGHFNSKCDVDEAYMSGAAAVRFAVSGLSGKMVTISRVESKKYKVTYSASDIAEIANKVKTLPTSWIKDGKDLTQEFIDYALPLIEGEERVNYKKGILNFAVLKKILVKRKK